MQLHCTTDVARREILAERSHSIFLSMWIVDQPLPWRPRAGNRGLGVTLLRALVTWLWYTGTQIVAFVWYNFVTPLLYTL